MREEVGSGFVPLASQSLGTVAVGSSPSGPRLRGPEARLPTPAQGCCGRPKATGRSPSAELPAPFPTLPLPPLAAAPRSECSDSSRNEPVSPASPPRGRLLGGGERLGRGCRRCRQPEPAGIVGGRRALAGARASRGPGRTWPSRELELRRGTATRGSRSLRFSESDVRIGQVK